MTALSDKSRSAIPGAALGPAGVGAPLPSNEAARLEALHRLGILDTPPEAIFDALTHIAAFATGAPIALISLVDETRQWFKSRVGLQASETPREDAFCAHAILSPGEPMLIEDATRDARFAANPLVTGEPAIRFYAGIPLTLRGGATVGTLCVIDREPRQLSAEQIRMLDALAQLAVSALDAHGETMAQQATMKLTNERLQLALEASGVSTWDSDLRSGVVRLSAGWAALIGDPPGETHTTMQDLMALAHPDDLDQAVRLSTEALRGLREEYSEEHRVRTRAGDWRWLLSRGKVLERDAGGRALRMIGSNVDITERKQREAALAESEARFRSQFALSAEFYWETDVGHRMTERTDNPGIPQTRFPEHAGNWHGKTRWEMPFVAPDAAGWQGHRDVLEARLPFRDFEFSRPERDGPVRHFVISGEPRLDAQGNFLGYRGVGSDITGAKRAKEALAESEERFRTIFERSDAGITLWDLAGVYISVNAAFTRFTGYGAEELVGRMTARDLLHPDDVNQQDISGRLTANSVGHFRRDQRYRCKDGRTVWGRVALALVRDAQGQPRYYIEVVSNITGARKVREKIERMNAELEERVAARTEALRAANKELEAFAYSVSHDLRAPIGAISGFASLLRKNETDRLTDDSRKLLGFIESNAARMSDLVDGLLSLSRIGQQAMAARRVPMQDLVNEVLADSAAAKGAEIRLGLLPECQGDPMLLRQVWTNLIGNALKYSRKREPARVEIGYDAAPRAYFVRDNGAGFDMQYAGKLFGVFERLHSESEFEGTGIGLATVQRIVQRHGGRVWAKSVPGKGATFWFTVQG